MILPYYRRLIRRVRAKTDAKIFHHSCGAVTKAADILVDAAADEWGAYPLRAELLELRRLVPALL